MLMMRTRNPANMTSPIRVTLRNSGANALRKSLIGAAVPSAERLLMLGQRAPHGGSRAAGNSSLAILTLLHSARRLHPGAPLIENSKGDIRRRLARCTSRIANSEMSILRGYD